MLKIRMELDPSGEDEIVIRCRALTPEVLKLQQMLANRIGRSSQFVLYKGDTEYYLEQDEILFFETESSQVIAHTIEDSFETRMKLYELEGSLGNSFLRISKSAIVNVNKIYSISRNLTASSAIEFQGTHKQIFVSRAYYKALKIKLEETRFES